MSSIGSRHCSTPGSARSWWPSSWQRWPACLADQIELLRSLPAWQARVAVAHTIPREELANREYTFDADRFRDLRVPTLFLEGGDSPEPFKAAGEAMQTALPNCRVAVMPGQRHAAMDTGTELFTAEVLSFLEATY